MNKKTIIMYSIPAYGHVNTSLGLMRRLNQEGFSVIYYSLEHFRPAIEANGCMFRSYPMEESKIDLSDGKRLLKLYRLLLQYTADILPQLLEEARKEKPSGIIFDSMALWGRSVGEILRIPKFSLYSILAIDGIFRKSFFCYASGFSKDFFRYVGELPKALQWREYLKQTYGIIHLDLLSVMMNQGDYNLMGYSRQIQPGGRWFGKKNLFMGPLSRTRAGQTGTLIPESKKKVVYISLGTIFNDDSELYEETIRCLGSKDVQVIMAATLNFHQREVLPDNFTVEPFLNQNEVLKKADIFLSAGGMNSIHEALFYGVPCLFYPKQGEQYLNAKQLEKLGFGLILKKVSQLEEMMKRAEKLKFVWSEEMRTELTKVRLKQVVRIIKSETAK